MTHSCCHCIGYHLLENLIVKVLEIGQERDGDRSDKQ